MQKYIDETPQSEVPVKVSIIIPAYNEEKRIVPVLNEIEGLITENNLDWEVIVAVDGNDRTLDIVNLYEQNYHIIKANHSIKREGMGGAIKRGILSSNSDLIILMDADGSTSLKNMLNSISILKANTYHIVNFDRYSEKGNFIPLRRRMVSRVFNIILRVIFKIDVNDTQCGYKIMRRDAILPFLKSITVSNAFFLTALFIYSRKAGLKSIEIPIKYKHSYGSKFNVLMTSLSYSISITAFWLSSTKYFYRIPKPIKNLYYKKLRFL